MSFSPFLPPQWLLGAGGLSLLSYILFLAFSQRRREAVFNRLNLRRRRASGASTPPRSFSPSRKASISVCETPDYLNSFPPSRRSALAELAEKNEKVLGGPEPALDFLVNNALPTTRSYKLDNDVPKYTPTGFSTTEIESLGDFPSYDILSGVPLPEPYEGFDPAKALPRPYRPFRWAYHQTMSLTKMEADWWLEVENTYVARIKERVELFREHGSKVLDYLPGSELACKELMEMCLIFYSNRYPTLFSLSSDKKIFTNNLLHTTVEIKRFHPLHVLLNHVPEDFAIVLRNEEDGMYYFRAGVICSSLGWNVGTKIGMGLREIHVNIPDYKEKMAFSMDRYFSKMPTSMPIQRGSWGLEVGSPLFMPPGHPHEKLREIQSADLTIEQCNLRVDWQTLRRLPLSAGIVFNFKALFTPIEEFRDEPYIPALVLKVLKEGKRNLMDYKGTWHVEHVVMPKLEEWAKEQEEKGIVAKDWEVTTLEESPYFPQWEEKWKRQQGF